MWEALFQKGYVGVGVALSRKSKKKKKSNKDSWITLMKLSYVKITANSVNKEKDIFYNKGGYNYY